MAAPLFWLPILNPLDVAQILAFIACAVWLRRRRA
jgi:membrane protein required for beta-lactamase induction